MAFYGHCFPILLLVCMLFLIHVPQASTKHDQSENTFEERGVRSKRSSATMADYYVHALFWRFRDQVGPEHDDEDVQFISIDGFKRLLTKLGLEAVHSHGHDHGDHDHGDHDGHDHGDHDGDDHEGHDHGDHEGHDHGDHEGHNHGDHDHGDHDGHDHGDHDGHDHGDHDGHDHGDHDGHDHGDHNGHDHGDHNGHNHRRKRAAQNDTENNEEEKDTCLSLGELLGEYDLSQATMLNADQFLHLSPALIDLFVSGACSHHDHDHEGHNHSEGDEDEESRNMGLVWLYMMLCVTVISLCAVWGILCIPKKSRSVYRNVIQFLMALAAGSMAGDALLHLLPHAMMPPHDHSAHGGHDDHSGHDHSGHDHGGHDDHGDHDDEHTKALLKGLMAVIGLYAFFFLERLFTVIMARSSAKNTADGKHREATTHMLHSHAEPFEDGVKFIATSPSNNTALTDVTASPGDGPEWNGKSHHWPHGGNNETDPDVEGSSNSSRQAGICPKLTSLALMIVLGDMFHNFCDGLAIGAAFSTSTTIGLSTSIAVFCHELPHEIGDFAVLIKTGLSNKQAVALNFISALSCYLGAVIGIFLGNIGHAPMWIFAGVAGMFLYIALVDLVPEMTHVYMTPGAPWAVYLGLHAGGLICGALLMLILGFYEHDIQMALA